MAPSAWLQGEAAAALAVGPSCLAAWSCQAAAAVLPSAATVAEADWNLQGTIWPLFLVGDHCSRREQAKLVKDRRRKTF